MIATFLICWFVLSLPAFAWFLCAIHLNKIKPMPINKDLDDDGNLFCHSQMLSLSPCEKWIEKHGINTHHNAHMEEPWCAFMGTFDDLARECVLMESDGRMVYGQTREEALSALALSLWENHGIKPWNVPQPRVTKPSEDWLQHCKYVERREMLAEAEEARRDQYQIENQ